MEKGWIKSYRKIMDNRFLMHDNNAFMVFVKLLHVVDKNTGEYASGRKAMGEMFNLNSRTLYDVLIRLQDHQMVNIEANSRYSVISICNWSEYQESPTAVPTSSQHLANSQPTSSQHYNKKENKKKNISKSVSEDQQLLDLLNEKAGRSFRTLPKGFKQTLKTFTLPEIAQALDNMKDDEWHSTRLGELSSSYLLRTSTIDTMLNKSTNSQADWLQQIKEASNAS